MSIFKRLLQSSQSERPEGHKVDGPSEILPLQITGMTCEGCSDSIRRFLLREKGVLKVNIDWKTGEGTVNFDPDTIGPDAILKSRIFSSGGYEAERLERGS